MSNSKTNEKIFELLIADALADSWNMELAQFDDDRQNEQNKFSDEFDRNIRRIRNSIGRKERVQESFRFTFKFIAAFAAIMGLVFGGLLTQPTVYAAVKNVVISVFDKYDRFDFISDNNDLTVKNFDDTIRLKYVPDGFRLYSGFYTPMYVKLIYTDNNDNEIIFSYSIAEDYSIDIDNEHKLYRTIITNGIEFHLYESVNEDFRSSILWYNNGYAFNISAYVPSNELIEIAESIK